MMIISKSSMNNCTHALCIPKTYSLFTITWFIDISVMKFYILHDTMILLLWLNILLTKKIILPCSMIPFHQTVLLREQCKQKVYQF